MPPRYPVDVELPAPSSRLRSPPLQRFRTPEGEREMRLTLDERTDETVSQLRNLPVWTAEGDKIPLAAMADFRLAPGPERIERENRRTGVRVGARYEEGTLNDYLPGVRAAMDSMEFPYGYTWTMSEWAEPAPAVARVPGQPGAGPAAGVRGDGRTVRVGAPSHRPDAGAALRARRSLLYGARRIATQVISGS
ncbi:MAG: efflux RND transporter permease subunit [bacterium]|nr:efflux RND transporter permease subunit [bacterium]